MPYKLLGEEPPESEEIQLPPKTPAASPLPSPKEVGGVMRNFLVRIILIRLVKESLEMYRR